MGQDAELGMLLAAACERYVRALFARLATLGLGHLTPSQALTVLLVGGGTDTVTALSERHGMSVPAISKICTALAGEGLLERAPDGRDARSRRLRLTPEGERVLGELRDAASGAERDWAAMVGADTLDTVRSALAAYARAPQEPAAPAVRIRFG